MRDRRQNRPQKPNRATVPDDFDGMLQRYLTESKTRGEIWTEQQAHMTRSERRRKEEHDRKYEQQFKLKTSEKKRSKNAWRKRAQEDMP